MAGGEDYNEQEFSPEVQERADNLRFRNPEKLADDARLAHADAERVEEGYGMERAQGYYSKAASLALLTIINQGERDWRERFGSNISGI